MEKALTFFRTFFLRFVGLLAIHLLMNWVWGDSETIGKSMVFAFLCVAILSLLDHFVLNPKKKG